MTNESIIFEETDIAIIGMATRVPGANNIDEFWDNLKNSVESYTQYTDEELLERGVSQETLNNPNYQKIGRPLDNMEMFDAALFGFSPKDASIMDPQHRHFLEVSWEALEHAGYDPMQYNGSIGVFGGSGHNMYMPANLMTNPELMKSIGLFLARHTSNDKDFLTTRVSYCLDLHGPSINVQTACSTSLVAVHLAAQSLLNGECDMALAGGVTIEMPHRHGYMYEEGGIQSPDGHCRAFDVNSGGTVFGSGAVQIVLKRMEDAVNDGDTIHAVIKGSAINNDGSSKVGYLAPSVDGQAAAITEALVLADVDADSISYVETHGTGTPVGDPIEIAALTQAYRTQTDRSDYCAIGSVKTNIGHLDTAAGGVGLVKIVQSMKHKQLPASLHFTAPNPALDFEDSPFYVNAKLNDWPATEHKRRAAINSLGVGGTNAHVIIEEAPELPSKTSFDGQHLICLSARTNAALDQVTHRLEAYLQENPQTNLSDLAYTLNVGRQALACRRIVVTPSIVDLQHALTGEDSSRLMSQVANDNKQSIYFMFTGQGAQYVNMCRDLYEEESVFKEAVDECSNILVAHIGLNLTDLLYPRDANEEASAAEKLAQTDITQPALFTIEYAMSKLLASWDIHADGMIGHSIGEYVAACLSGLFSLNDALKLVAARGRLMQSMPKGSMLVVPQNEEDVSAYLNNEISLAAINAPGLSVLSGTDQAIDALAEKIENNNLETTRLHTSHAFHSSMMEPILEEFKSLFHDITFGQIEKPFISNVSGDWINAEEASTAEYWAQHLRGTVRFADGMSTLMSNNNAVFIECGPGRTLSTFARQSEQKESGHNIVQTIRHIKQVENDVYMARSALGRLWLSGININWNAAHGDLPRYRIALPTYPFEHQRYWIEPGQGALDLQVDKNLHKQDFNKWFYQPGWDSSAAILEPSKDELDNVSIACFINNSTESEALIEQLKNKHVNCYVIKAGDVFKQISDYEYQINITVEADYKNVLKAINEHLDTALTHIVHAWTIHESPAESMFENMPKATQYGFNSLLFIAKYYAANELDAPLSMSVITNHSQQLSSESITDPLKSMMLGPVKVMTQEINHLSCKFIDVDFDIQQKWKKQNLIECLCHDILSQPDDDEMIAYRGLNRYVRRYQQLDIAPQTHKNLLKNAGNYLITGGVGGVGYEIAQHLAKQYQANLIILNRTPLPDESEWDNLETCEAKVAERIKKIQSLQQHGTKVLSINADVTNLDALQNAVQISIAELGSIDGVFHTAGIVDDNLIAFKTVDEAEKVFAPKIMGVINLDKVLNQQALDFIFLFSSVSCELGLSGQVDYVAANSFLNAYAQYKRDLDGTNVIAANWGIWAEAGMASQIGLEKGLINQQQAIQDHYFYEQKNTVSSTVVEYSSMLSAKTHWILDEHRAKNKACLIPGTAYLELARSAFEYENKESKAIQISDVFFLSPFVTEGDEEKQINVQLSKQTQHTDFLIKSEFGEENVRGSIKYIEKNAPESIHIEHIIERCSIDVQQLKGTAEHNHLIWGDRWRCINTVSSGKKEAVIELELDNQFVNELSDYILHPAIMDMATGAAQALNPDYNPVEDLYIPISYSSIEVYRTLEQKVFSHVIYKAEEGQGTQTSIFDIVVSNAAGEVLLVIKQFVMKRVEPQVLASLKSNRAPQQELEKTPSDVFFDMGLQAGMTNQEGLEAIDVLMTSLNYPQVIVSSLPFNDYVAEARKLRQHDDFDEAEDEASFDGLDRPNLSTEFIAPNSKLEKEIAKVWRMALGVAEVGINDDFFELGGHSLLLTQVVSRLKKSLSIDLPINSLFEVPTIAKWAEVIDKNDNAESELVPLVVPVNREDYIVKYNELKLAV